MPPVQRTKKILWPQCVSSPSLPASGWREVLRGEDVRSGQTSVQQHFQLCQTRLHPRPSRRVPERRGLRPQGQLHPHMERGLSHSLVFPFLTSPSLRFHVLLSYKSLLLPPSFTESVEICQSLSIASWLTISSLSLSLPPLTRCVSRVLMRRSSDWLKSVASTS